MLDLVQGSDAWLAARAGSLGASMIGDALARTKTGWGASRANLLSRLATERLTGKPTETFSNGAMQRGLELEPQARAWYSFSTGHDVAEVGIVPHPTLAHTHCSPDGLIGEGGMVELKCCGQTRHFELLNDSPPEDRYVKQCLWQLACTGRGWVDLAYFHPDFPTEMQLVVHRIERDAEAIAALEADVAAFLAEVDALLVSTRNRYLQQKAA